MKKGFSLIRFVFVHADGFDICLMLLGVLGTMGHGLSMPITLLVASKLMNNVGNTTGSSPGTDFTHNINKNALALCYVAAGQWGACFLEAYCWTRTGERQASRMRASYLKAVLRQDVGYFDMHITSTAEVIETVTGDSLAIQDVISEKVPHFLMNVTTFLGGYVIAFTMLWRLAIVGAPFVVLLLIPGLIYGRNLTSIAREVRGEYEKANTIVQQAILSIRTVYSFVGEHKTLAEYTQALEGTTKLGLKQGLAKGLAIGSNGITFAIWAFLAYYGSRLVMYHNAGGGTVYMVGIIITVGGLSLGSALSDVKYFSEASMAGERIMKVIKRLPIIDSENMEGQILENVSGEIEFKHVQFAYPSRPQTIVFKDFNLKVPAGRTVALVGESGSGKSTVVSLLQRFYDPLGGEINLDGVPIDKLQLKWLRSQIGLVSQEPALYATTIKENILFGKEDADTEQVIAAAIASNAHNFITQSPQGYETQWLRSQIGLVSQEPALYATTIKENILFGKEDADTEQVIAAAKASNAHNFITQLPQGYETQVGERGVQMSGGQKQRIAIARSIIKQPRILLLDEATSALDSESERVVQEALDIASVGRTTIVIAHRLSTVRNADLIAVVNKGHVVEIGSHDELIADTESAYSSLVQLQSAEKSEIELNKAVTIENDDTIVTVDGNNASRRRLSLVSRSSSVSSVAHSKRQEENITTSENQVVVGAPSFQRLLSMNLPEWKQAIIGFTSAILFGAVQPAYSFAMGSMITVYFLTDHDEIKRQTRIYALCFFGLSICSLLINISQHYYLGYMGEYLTKRVRERMLSKILTFEVGWFDQDENASGAICFRLSRDANTVRSLVGDRMALLIQATSAVIVAFTMGLIISWRFGIVLIAIQPLIIVCYYCRSVLLKSMSKKASQAQEESSKLASEAVSNLRTVTAFSSQTRILNLFRKAQEGPEKENIRRSWYGGFGLAMARSITTLTWAFTFWYGAKLISGGHLSSKAYFETTFILFSTGNVIADAATLTNDLAKGSDSVGSVFAVLDRLTQIEPEDPEGYKPENITGHVELLDVEFSYPTRSDIFIFNGFSIEIEAGKSTALVGQSGSGKSTVIGLIERFYDPIRGVVKIDGQNIKSYSLRSLRKLIAIVSQEPTLFAGTIRENITYGAPNEIEESEIIEVAKAANAHDFISGLQDGYDTFCGDRGLQLSGGQKQRIAIARAILKNPKILLLDEATSALDTKSEKVVQEALDRLMVARTSVVVAHRLSTIQNCDTIAVLEKGKLVEKGSHSSLISKGAGGAYYSLVTLQRSSNSSHTIN